MAMEWYTYQEAAQMTSIPKDINNINWSVIVQFISASIQFCDKLGNTLGNSFYTPIVSSDTLGNTFRTPTVSSDTLDNTFYTPIVSSNKVGNTFYTPAVSSTSS
jgi:hypothetical protein